MKGDRGLAIKTIADSSLVERLVRLRQMQVETPEQSRHFLRMILTLAAEAVEFGEVNPDPRRKVLTQIFAAYKPAFTPDILGRIVTDIDHIVVVSSCQGWRKGSYADKLVKTEIRKMLAKYGLERTGEMFDKVCSYVQANY